MFLTNNKRTLFNLVIYSEGKYALRLLLKSRYVTTSLSYNINHLLHLVKTKSYYSISSISPCAYPSKRVTLKLNPTTKEFYVTYK